MSKVDNPKFNGWAGKVKCPDCPWGDENGISLVDGGCSAGGMGWLDRCPSDTASYAEACALAEAAEKEGR